MSSKKIILLGTLALVVVVAAYQVFHSGLLLSQTDGYDTQTAATLTAINEENGRAICAAIDGVNVSASDFGADGSDEKSDSFTIQQALECLILKSRENGQNAGTLHIPSGRYYLDEPIALTNLIWFDGHGFTIEGDGPMQTQIIVQNPTAGFSFEIERVGLMVTMRNMRLVADQPGIKNAIKITSPDRGATHHRQVIMEDIDIGGVDGVPPQENYFNDAIRLFGIHRPYLENIYITGAYGPDSQERWYDMNSCYDFEDTYGPVLVQVRCWSASNGLMYYTNKPVGTAGPEGGIVEESAFVEVGRGIYVKSMAQEPHFTVIDSHINAEEVGIEVDGRRFVSLTNNLFYRRAHDGHYNDIELNGVERSSITNNIFHAPFRQNDLADATRSMIQLNSLPVQVANGNTDTYTSTDILVNGNIFAPEGQPVDNNTGGMVLMNNNLISDTNETDGSTDPDPAPPVEEPDPEDENSDDQVSETSPSYVTVTYPNTNSVSVVKGETLTIQWEDDVVNDYPYFVNVRNATESFQLDDVAFGRSFEWQVPNSFEAGGYVVQICRRLYSDVEEGRCDQSDALFTVTEL
jgi:hypothetical protein